MAGGRPSEFKIEYCEKLIKHMSEGLSFESFAGAIKTSKQTLYNWLEHHPEFVDAKKEGFEASRLTWEKIGLKIAKTGEGNSTSFIFNMKNRFKEDWRDKHETEVTIPEGVTINISLDANCEPIKD